jgi:hypothetical protein
MQLSTVTSSSFFSSPTLPANFDPTAGREVSNPLDGDPESDLTKCCNKMLDPAGKRPLPATGKQVTTLSTNFYGRKLAGINSFSPIQ